MTDGKYLLRVQMDAFGKFAGHTVGPFTPGFNVVYGPNEAGKSSVVEFVRQILYGWSRANSTGAYNDYIPRERERAGRLVFASDEGEWELTRRKGNRTEVRTLRGLTWDDAFEDLKGQITQGTYQGVFSFSADEFPDYSRGAEGVVSHLLTAGSGTVQAPVSALQTIDERIKALQSRQKDEPLALGSLSRDIEELRGRIRTLEDSEHELGEDRLELTRLEERERELTREYDDLHMRADRLRGRSAELAGIEAELAKLDREMAEVGVELDEHRALADAAVLTDSEQRDVQRFERVEAAYAQLPALQTDLSRYRDRKHEIELLRAELEQEPVYTCDLGETTKERIVGRQRKRDQLESDVSAAISALDDLNAQGAAIEVREQHQAEHARGIAPSPALIAIAIIAILGGAAVVALGAARADKALLGSGCVLIAVGIMTLVLAFPTRRRTAAAQAAAEMAARRLAHDEQLAQASSKLSDAEKRLVDFNQESETLLAQMGFDGVGMSLGHALKQLEAAEHIEEKRRALAAKSEQASDAADDLTRAVSQMKERLFADEDDGSLSDMSAVDLVAWISAAHTRAIHARTRREAYDRAAGESARFEAHMADLTTRRDAAISKRDEVLDACGIGSAQDAAFLISGRLRKADQRLAELEQERDRSVGRRGELRTILDNGACEEHLTQLREQLELKRAQQGEAAYQLAELVLAREMLVRSIRSWEQTRQPAVYRIASRLFSDMTAGQWRNVAYDGGELFVLDSMDERLTPDKLSLGTRQQLYLALRIALLLSADDVGRDLPIMADDIFVNFDDVRRERAAEALAALAEKRQVVLFTCHEGTVDLLQRACPQANRIDL